MPVFETEGFRFHTRSSLAPVGTRTLIISSHGVQTGATFKKPYPTVIQFASRREHYLIADLEDAIKGRVTTAELAKTGPSEDDYQLYYFEHDPTDSRIDAMLQDNADVLTFKKEYTDTVEVTLSYVLKHLAAWKLLYPGILCVFCRGKEDDLLPIWDGKHYAPTYSGRSSPSLAQHNMHQINATAIALELKAKGKAT